MRTGNPALSDKTFALTGASEQRMTLNGVVNKSGIMLMILLVCALYVWNRFFSTGQAAEAVMPFLWGGLIGGLVVALVTVFKPHLAKYTAIPDAALEGLALGAISAFFEARYPGIVLQAVGLTFAVFFSLLVVYRSGMIKVTENFKMMVVAATGGIFVVYMISFVMSFFGSSIPFIHEGGIIGIGFSLFVVAIAALNLVLDFDFIEKGVERGAPQYMEWYGSFALLVTLVWLYLEILRLLAKTRR